MVFTYIDRDLRDMLRVWELNVSCFALNDELFIADGCTDDVHSHVNKMSVYMRMGVSNVQMNAEWRERVCRREREQSRRERGRKSPRVWREGREEGVERNGGKTEKQREREKDMEKVGK